eukprot:IDg2627t1
MCEGSSQLKHPIIKEDQMGAWMFVETSFFGKPEVLRSPTLLWRFMYRPWPSNRIP